MVINGSAVAAVRRSYTAKWFDSLSSDVLSRSLSTLRHRLTRGDTGVAVVFYAAVTLYAGWLVVAGAQYRPDTRLFPTIVGAVVLTLVGLRAVTPGLRRRFDLASGGLFDHLGADRVDADADDGVDETVRTGLVLFGWLALLVGLFRLAGPLVAIAAVTGGYVAVHRGTPRTALLLSLSVTAAVFLLFVVVLNLPGYDPLLAHLVEGRL